MSPVLLRSIPKLVVLDFETTQSPDGLRSVEIAALLFERGEPAGEIATLTDPRCPIDRWSYRCHGISSRQVAGQPRFADIWDDLYQMLRGSVVAAHNAPFDAGALRDEIFRLGVAPPAMRWWCTCRLARHVWPKRFPNYKLATLADRLGLEGSNTHRAADDARLAEQLLRRELADARKQGRDSLELVEPLALQSGGKSWPF